MPDEFAHPRTPESAEHSPRRRSVAEHPTSPAGRDASLREHDAAADARATSLPEHRTSLAGRETSDRGRVLAVCLGPGGIPKHPAASASVVELGLVGDAHRFEFHGGAHRAVCLFAIEDYRKLALDGVNATPPGAYGENVLTEGLDYARLSAGDRLALGDARERDDAGAIDGERSTSIGDDRARDDEVVLEIHDVREPCKTLKPIDARFPNLMLGRSGFLCRVVRGGVLRPGMTIRKLATA